MYLKPCGRKSAPPSKTPCNAAACTGRLFSSQSALSALASGLSALASGPLALASGPLALASGPSALASGLSALASGSLAIAAGPLALASGLELRSLPAPGCYPCTVRVRRLIRPSAFWLPRVFARSLRALLVSPDFID
jgi:hypothetical protein